MMKIPHDTLKKLMLLSTHTGSRGKQRTPYSFYERRHVVYGMHKLLAPSKPSYKLCTSFTARLGQRNLICHTARSSISLLFELFVSLIILAPTSLSVDHRLRHDTQLRHGAPRVPGLDIAGLRAQSVLLRLGH